MNNMPSETKTSNGGVAFVLDLEPGKEVPNTSKMPSPPKSKSEHSLDEINSKLAAAEERRKSMESSLLEKLAKENEQILQVQSKVKEQNNNFMKSTKEKIDADMGKFEENYKALEEERKQKAKEKNERIEKVRERKKEIGSGDGSEAAS
ncbi:stathmin-like isoform X1 [Anneissia japonica]|uniref:stathmin-like isoform X1 n=2 Tax=Anneissia japonica TaxID=1529436 RepID=UPI001425AF3A|nr:stathmin-like isoform X1 [Anneissia japonica]